MDLTPVSQRAPEPLLHGGPDALGVPLHDFSTNRHAGGPCPQALAALQRARHDTYPDPAYSALRARLAALHGVTPSRVLLAASASELIGRMTAAMVRQGARTVALPQHGYADYTRAAGAWGMRAVDTTIGADLVWCCEPSSPLGQHDPVLAQWANAQDHQSAIVLDCAYAPLRLADGPRVLTADPRPLWQLWSPNKALGLTGVRGAYAIAPTDCADLIDTLQQLAPSWPLGSDGVALLDAWTDPAAQRWLTTSLPTLRAWDQRQRAVCRRLGWQPLPSLANFFTARLPDMFHAPLVLDEVLRQLRTHGIKLRDTRSFGLPGHVRLGVLPPSSHDALAQAWPMALAAACEVAS